MGNAENLNIMKDGFFRGLPRGIPPITCFALGLLVSALGTGIVDAADRPGYLPDRGPNLGRIRTLPPPKPQIPALPPLPQTYVPEPKHTAEFIAQLRVTSAQFRTNLSVRAETPDPVYLGSTLTATANPMVGPSVALDVSAQTEAILGYFSAGGRTNGVQLFPRVTGATGIDPIVPIVLPVNGLFKPQPAASGKSRATYELK